MPLDRTGEPIEDDDTGTVPVHPANCNGWIDYYTADHPRPCLVCKPHLARPPARHDRSREEASRP